MLPGWRAAIYHTIVECRTRTDQHEHQATATPTASGVHRPDAQCVEKLAGRRGVVRCYTVLRGKSGVFARTVRMERSRKNSMRVNRRWPPMFRSMFTKQDPPPADSVVEWKQDELLIRAPYAVTSAAYYAGDMPDGCFTADGGRRWDLPHHRPQARRDRRDAFGALI